MKKNQEERINLETWNDKGKYLQDLYEKCKGNYESYINDYYEEKTNITQVEYLETFISFQEVEIDNLKEQVKELSKKG